MSLYLVGFEVDGQGNEQLQSFGAVDITAFFLEDLGDILHKGGGLDQIVLALDLGRCSVDNV